MIGQWRRAAPRESAFGYARPVKSIRARKGTIYGRLSRIARKRLGRFGAERRGLYGVSRASCRTSTRRSCIWGGRDSQFSDEEYQRDLEDRRAAVCAGARPTLHLVVSRWVLLSDVGKARVASIPEMMQPSTGLQQHWPS